MLHIAANMLVPGAGNIVHVPVNGTNTESDSSQHVKAYLIQPAPHVGRIVTGVLMLVPAEHSICSATNNIFSHAAITFADKLAEQSYKVLVIDCKAASNATAAAIAYLESIAQWFQETFDVQRLAVLGMDRGADVVLDLQSKCAFDSFAQCCIASSPLGLEFGEDWEPHIPNLILVGEKSAFLQTAQFLNIRARIETFGPTEAIDRCQLRVFRGQGHSFAFEAIENEDAATQCLSQILDWLLLYLYRFRTAACTSDRKFLGELEETKFMTAVNCSGSMVKRVLECFLPTDFAEWVYWFERWPQGRNGPFLNIGLQKWLSSRLQWTTETHERCSNSSRVPASEIVNVMTAVRRTFELPHPMRLGDLVLLLADVWQNQH